MPTGINPLATMLRAELKEGRRWACQEMGWDGVARQWEELFAERLQ